MTGIQEAEIYAAPAEARARSRDAEPPLRARSSDRREATVR